MRVFLILLSMFFFFSCGKDKESPPQVIVEEPESPQEPENNPPDPCLISSPPGVADGGQTQDYHKVGSMPVIIARGSAPPNRFKEFHPDGIVWSSDTDMPSNISQDIFISNSRFHLRVKALSGIQGVDDAKGIACNQVPLPYTKLNIGVTVRRADAVSGDTFIFRDVGVALRPLLNSGSFLCNNKDNRRPTWPKKSIHPS